MHTADLMHVSGELHNHLGTIAEGINRMPDITLTLGLTMLRNTVLGVAKDLGIKPEEWKYAHKPHDVFIEPIEVHAFVKLQSSVACLINAAYLNDSVLFKHAIFDVEHYIDKIASVFIQ